MEAFVAKQLYDFETGKISRRRLIETLTVAATTAYAAGTADAAESTGLKAALVNHISYTCPDFKKAADWYSMVFNLDQVGATKNDVALPFGKKGDQPFGVAANDVPLTHLIIRSRDLNAPPPTGGPPRRKSAAVVDHVAYTVADFDRLGRRRSSPRLASKTYARPGNSASNGGRVRLRRPDQRHRGNGAVGRRLRPARLSKGLFPRAGRDRNMPSVLIERPGGHLSSPPAPSGQTSFSSSDRLYAIRGEGVPPGCGIPIGSDGLSNLTAIGLSQRGIGQRQNNCNGD